jgi:hypothetical protein
MAAFVVEAGKHTAEPAAIGKRDDPPATLTKPSGLSSAEEKRCN